MRFTLPSAMPTTGIKSYTRDPIQHVNRMWIGPLGFSQCDGRVSGA
jgi:hypothetical protein